MESFPSLDGFGPTRATLHAYARVFNTLTRAHAQSRPHWWHTSLKLTDTGLITDPLPLPSGGSAVLKMNFDSHQIELEDDAGQSQTFPMDQGWSGTQMGEALIAALAGLGLQADYVRTRYENDAPGIYDAAVAARFHRALLSAKRVFETHLSTLSGTVSVVQLWPHNFDMSAEWYGTKMIPYESNGKTTELPVQLNLGFYPGENDQDTYFYSNPWPFEADHLINQTLPEGASWHTDGWLGTELPYTKVADQPDAEQTVLDFATGVYTIVMPTLID